MPTSGIQYIGTKIAAGTALFLSNMGGPGNAKSLSPGGFGGWIVSLLMSCQEMRNYFSLLPCPSRKWSHPPGISGRLNAGAWSYLQPLIAIQFLRHSESGRYLPCSLELSKPDHQRLHTSGLPCEAFCLSLISPTRVYEPTRTSIKLLLHPSTFRFESNLCLSPDDYDL